jgi:hypothetical protein
MQVSSNNTGSPSNPNNDALHSDDLQYSADDSDSDSDHEPSPSESSNDNDEADNQGEPETGQAPNQGELATLQEHDDMNFLHQKSSEVLAHKTMNIKLIMSNTDTSSSLSWTKQSKTLSIVSLLKSLDI